MVKVLAWELDPDILRTLRERAMVGSRELSEELGHASSFISKLENGPTRTVLESEIKRVAELLAGRGNLKTLDAESIMAVLQGRMTLQETIRLVPVPDKLGSDPVNGSYQQTLGLSRINSKRQKGKTPPLLGHLRPTGTD